MEKISRILPPSRRTQVLDSNIRNNLRPGAPNFIGKPSANTANILGSNNLGPALEKPDADRPQYNESADNSAEMLEGVFGTDARRFPTDRISIAKSKLPVQQEKISQIDEQDSLKLRESSRQKAVAKAPESTIIQPAKLKDDVFERKQLISAEANIEPGEVGGKKPAQDPQAYERMKEMKRKKSVEDITQKFMMTQPKQVTAGDDELKSEKYVKDVEKKSNFGDSVST